MAKKPTPSPGILDKLTGSIGKITALIATILALVATVSQLPGAWKSIRKYLGQESSCVDLELICPDTVLLSEWKSRKLNLRLKVDNTCEEEPVTYVVLRVAGGGRITGEPPFKDDLQCKSEISSCWEKGLLKKGSYHWLLTPPDLNYFQDRFGEPFSISINWIVYKMDGTSVDIGTAGFLLEDDRPGTSAGTAALWRNDKPSNASLSALTQGGLFWLGAARGKHSGGEGEVNAAPETPARASLQ